MLETMILLTCIAGVMIFIVGMGWSLLIIYTRIYRPARYWGYAPGKRK